jgi:translation initiation factor IF-1
MSKETSISLSGVVKEVLPNCMFRVELETGPTIIGYISGRMRQNEIKILMGDAVSIECSPYDLSRGRIIKRL